MVDGLAHLVVAPAVRLAGQGEVIVLEAQPFGNGQRRGVDHRFQIRHHGLGRGLRGVVLPHHDPADIVQHRAVQLVEPGGPDIDHPGLAVRVLLQPDHLGLRPQRVAGPDRRQEPALGIAKVRHRVQRHVGHGLAEDDVERHQIVQGRTVQPAVLREHVRGIQRMPRRIQRVVQRPLALAHRAGDGVVDHVADAVILEEAARIGLGHHCSPSFRSGLYSPGTSLVTACPQRITPRAASKA